MQSAHRESGPQRVEKSGARADRDRISNPVKSFRAKPAPIPGLPPPPPSTPPRRWVAQRKAEVMDAVRGGLLSLNEALDRYSLTLEEYLSWRRQIDRFGMEGLRANAPRPRPSPAECSNDANFVAERSPPEVTRGRRETDSRR